MLAQELRRIAEPALRELTQHPFWSGLKDGSLPGAALERFVQQDTTHLLPAFARILLRCAALTRDDDHATLLAHAATATIEARDRLRREFTALAPGFGVAEPETVAAPHPSTREQCDFYTAAAARSLAAGIGAVLPMVWFNLPLSDDLRDHVAPGGRYAGWIAAYHPGDGFRAVVPAFLDLAEQVGEQRTLVEHFAVGVRYEWAFAESIWSG
jgi:thiaminase/transcriptional activator TenA